MMPRVLIVTASVGNGHISAARAIEEECASRGLPVENVDMIEFTPKAFQTWYRGGYEKAVKDTPKMWGLLYWWSDVPGPLFDIQDWLDTTFCVKLDGIVERFQPDIVVCVHSLPQPRLDRIRRAGRPFQIAVVVTDMHPHKMWLRGRPDVFFVPSEWSVERLMSRLPELQREQIHVVGIPVNRAFAAAPDEPRSEEPMVVVTSGGIGGGPIVEAVDALARMPQRAKIVAVSGRNAAAKRDLDAHRETLPDWANPVEVRGHVPLAEMASLVKRCTVLVGKSGGITTYEALAAGAPFVVYMPFLIPGQEEQNAVFLADCGAAVQALDPQDLVRRVGHLLESSEDRQAMRERAFAAAMPHSARQIVDGLLASLP